MSLQLRALAAVLLAITSAARASEPGSDSDLIGCYALDLSPSRLPVTVTGNRGFTMNPTLPTRVRLDESLHPEFAADKRIHYAERLDAKTPDPLQTWQRLEDGRLVLWMADGAYALRVVLQGAADVDAWTGTARSESEITPIEYTSGKAALRRIKCPAAS